MRALPCRVHQPHRTDNCAGKKQKRAQPKDVRHRALRRGQITDEACLMRGTGTIDNTNLLSSDELARLTVGMDSNAERLTRRRLDSDKRIVARAAPTSALLHSDDDGFCAMPVRLKAPPDERLIER